MTQVSAPHAFDHGGSNQSGSNQSKGPHLPHGARRLAEWVSFGVSAAVVLALAGYLVYDALRDSGPVVPVEVIVAYSEASMAEQRHVVPIHVRNNGRRTLKQVKVDVTHRTADGSTVTDSFEIDYLPEAARETIYFYLEIPPRDAHIEAQAMQYRLE